MDSSFWFYTIHLGWSIVSIKGLQVRIIIFQLFTKKISENRFDLANSADPDEMLRYAAFHLGLHCLQKYPKEVSI